VVVDRDVHVVVAEAPAPVLSRRRSAAMNSPSTAGRDPAEFFHVHMDELSEASLIPSPNIATTRPSLWSRLTSDD